MNRSNHLARLHRSIHSSFRATTFSLLVVVSAVGSIGCASSTPTANAAAKKLMSSSRTPIVLVHGMAGFPWNSGMPYFKGLPEALSDRGDVVVVAALPPYDDSSVRATFLADAIDAVLLETRSEKVHVIAHSQGGLDARYLIEDQDYGSKIRSLTTVSTPHHGSPVADLAFTMVPDVLLDASLGVHGYVIGSPDGVTFTAPDGSASVRSLTSDERARRNALAKDAAVPIFSFAGASGAAHDPICRTGFLGSQTKRSATQLTLLPTWALIAMTDREAARASDGLVPTSSAAWGTFLGCLPADHMELMGYGGLAVGGDHAVELDFVTFFVDYVAALHVLDDGGTPKEAIARMPRVTSQERSSSAHYRDVLQRDSVGMRP